jgi:sec-independent protein translocase protein TatA
MMNLGFWEWIVIAVVVMLLFGTKRLRSAGEDLGVAIRGFRKSVQGEGDSLQDSDVSALSQQKSQDLRKDV